MAGLTPRRKEHPFVSFGKRVVRAANPGPDGHLELVLPVAAGAAVLMVLILIVFFWLIVMIFSAGKASSEKILPAVLTASISTTALIGASLGAVYAFRKQILAEREGVRADQQVYSDRFVKAAELLANEKPSARLSGLHLLANLADDWADGRNACAMAICSYLRLPPSMPDGDSADDIGEREVRRTAWKAIKTRLAHYGAANSWHSQELDFSGGQFVNVDLELSQLSAVNLQFRGCSFNRGEIRLGGAKLTAGAIDFTGASFDGTTIIMQGMELSGKALVVFDHAKIKDCTFILDMMELGSRSSLLVRNADIRNSKFKFDSDGVGYFFQGTHSIANGEVDFSRSKLNDVTISMHAYRMTGRFVLDQAVTSNVAISIPGELTGSPYVNLDVNAQGPTELSIGPGKMEGGRLVIRPRVEGTPGSLTAEFINFAHIAGEIEVGAQHNIWKKFYFDAMPESEGSLSLIGRFPSGVDAEINTTVDDD